MGLASLARACSHVEVLQRGRFVFCFLDRDFQVAFVQVVGAGEGAVGPVVDGVGFRSSFRMDVAGPWAGPRRPSGLPRWARRLGCLLLWCALTVVSAGVPGSGGGRRCTSQCRFGRGGGVCGAAGEQQGCQGQGGQQVVWLFMSCPSFSRPQGRGGVVRW